MAAALTGRIHGTVIELDSPLPDLEGQRVRVVIEAVNEASPEAGALRDAWKAWVARGPDGPIPDDDAPEFP